MSRDVVFKEESRKKYVPTEIVDDALPNFLDNKVMYSDNQYEESKANVEQILHEDNSGCAEQQPRQEAVQRDQSTRCLRNRKSNSQASPI